MCYVEEIWISMERKFWREKILDLEMMNYEQFCYD
jgi:hypothetical protein